MANVRVTAGLNELLSLVTFFAAAKKVTPAPGRGSANKPPRTRDPAKTNSATSLFRLNTLFDPAEPHDSHSRT
jgi:hypothetical protein